MDHVDCEVLVVGAGPTGLSTALSLIAQGVNVRIISDVPARHATPRASSIHARTLELLAPFGVSERIAAYAHPIRNVLFFDEKGLEIYRREMKAIDSHFPAQINLQQWQTEWIIAEQLLARGIDIHSSTRLVSLKQDTDKVVAEVETETGKSLIRCRYLIGADGARSTVRKVCCTRMVGKDYPERWIAGELKIENTEVIAEVRALFERERFAFQLPLDGAVMFFAILRDDEFPDARPGPADPEQVLEIYNASIGKHPHLASVVKRVPWSGHFQMHSCCVPNFQIGRVFLAGDAAHLVSAAGGYGMNLGIQDGINLSWRLAAHLRLNVDAKILHGYNIDRQEMFQKINELSDAAHQMMARHDADSLKQPFLRQSSYMATADRTVGEVGLSYSQDRMFRDEAISGELRAGMRVPLTANFSSGEGETRSWSSIYDGFNWTIVLAVSNRTTLRTADIMRYDTAALVWLNARARIVVAVGDAFVWNAPRPTLYVVRPDGYIAFRADSDPDQLPDIDRLTSWLIDNFAGSIAPSYALE